MSGALKTASPVLAGLAALALALAACSTAGSSPPDSGRTGAAGAGGETDVEVTQEDIDAVERILDEPPPGDPGPDVGGITLQESILADYHVTFAEYEQAVRAAVSCIEDEGFTVVGPARYPDPGAGLLLVPGLDPTQFFGWAYREPSDDDLLDETEGRCRAQWSYWVETVWQEQHKPSEQEIQAWLERAWECARQQGLPLSDPPTQAEAMQAAGGDCRPWEDGT